MTDNYRELWKERTNPLPGLGFSIFPQLRSSIHFPLFNSWIITYIHRSGTLSSPPSRFTPRLRQAARKLSPPSLTAPAMAFTNSLLSLDSLSQVKSYVRCLLLELSPARPHIDWLFSDLHILIRFA